MLCERILTFEGLKGIGSRVGSMGNVASRAGLDPSGFLGHFNCLVCLEINRKT